MFGTLYIVATPIGNLGDVTKRAIETLGTVDLIAAEDTRVTGKLMLHLNIHKPFLSYHQQSSDAKKHNILLKLLEGKNVALVTDAGTPGISDPGNELIAFILGAEPNIKVVPIPGPSALTAALSICGFNVSKFTFLGFVPKKGKRKIFGAAKESGIPFVFFESPHRIVKTLEELGEVVGEERKVFVGQELTKLYERSLRGTIAEVKEILESERAEAGRVRGEIVVVLEF